MSPPIDVTPPASAAPPLPGYWRLMWLYFVVGATGFGGSMPWLRRALVDDRRWISAEEFNQAISLAQFLPGPNVFNLLAVLGNRFYGIRGVVGASIAIMIVPFILACVFGALYMQYGDAAVTRGLMRGLAPVAAGLMLVLAIKTAGAQAMRHPIAIVFALGTFIAVAFFRVSLPVVMLVIAPLSIALAWMRVPR